MKILKLKFGLFSLLVTIAVTAFLTSCEQNEIQTNENQMFNEIQESDKLVLPFGINENEYLAIEYLNSATDNQIHIWKNNAKVTEELASIGKLDEVKSLLTMGENISELDFKKVLSNEDITMLNQEGEEIESRGCVRDFLGSAVCSGNAYPCYCHWALKKCCKPPYGDCYFYWYLDC